jgi:NADH pyrophosphatase NudC (nudix superfamily)
MSQINETYLKEVKAKVEEALSSVDRLRDELAFLNSALARDAEQRNEADKGRAAGDFESPQFCGNCGVPRFVHDGILEKCPKCGDDEIDMSMQGDIP